MGNIQMTIYEGFYELPLLTIEDSFIWQWLQEKASLNHETRIDGGFLIAAEVLVDYYIKALRSYIEFNIEDHISLDQYYDLLDIIYSFVDAYRDSYIVLLSVF